MFQVCFVCSLACEEMWLADVEFKLQSVKLGNQLDRLQDDRTAALEAIASIQAPCFEHTGCYGGDEKYAEVVTPDQKKMGKKWQFMAWLWCFAMHVALNKHLHQKYWECFWVERKLIFFSNNWGSKKARDLSFMTKASLVAKHMSKP